MSAYGDTAGGGVAAWPRVREVGVHMSTVLGEFSYEPRSLAGGILPSSTSINGLSAALRSTLEARRPPGADCAARACRRKLNGREARVRSTGNNRATGTGPPKPAGRAPPRRNPEDNFARARRERRRADDRERPASNRQGHESACGIARRRQCAIADCCVPFLLERCRNRATNVKIHAGLWRCVPFRLSF